MHSQRMKGKKGLDVARIADWIDEPIQPRSEFAQEGRKLLDDGSGSVRGIGETSPLLTDERR